jgi:hypothetical protein
MRRFSARYHPTQDHELAAAILEQLKGEADANMNYEALLGAFAHRMDPEDVATIKEIRSDECNHSLKLQAMVKKYDGSIAASGDEIIPALKEVAEGIPVKASRKPNRYSRAFANRINWSYNSDVDEEGGWFSFWFAETSFGSIIATLHWVNITENYDMANEFHIQVENQFGKWEGTLDISNTKATDSNVDTITDKVWSKYQRKIETLAQQNTPS